MPEFIQSQIPWLSPPWSLTSAVAIVTLSAAVLAIGADWTVDASVRVAESLRVSPRVIGLTLVAVGTSAPEFAVSATAALGGSSQIAFSNVVGSNIFNLGFILGGVALVRPLKTDASLVWRDGAVLLLSAVSVWLLFGIDLRVERSNGVLLLLALVGYVAFLVFRSKSGLEPAEGPSEDGVSGRMPAGVALVVGIVLIAMSAELLVEASTSIASSLGLSEWIIGMTIVAAGTSLPELTTSIVAALKGHHSLGLGNIIGSDIFNVLGVLGLAAVIRPVGIEAGASGSILALVGMVLLALTFMRTGWRLDRWEGGVLLGLGLVRWALDFTGPLPA